MIARTGWNIIEDMKARRIIITSIDNTTTFFFAQVQVRHAIPNDNHGQVGCQMTDRRVSISSSSYKPASCRSVQETTTFFFFFTHSACAPPHQPQAGRGRVNPHTVDGGYMRYGFTIFFLGEIRRAVEEQEQVGTAWAAEPPKSATRTAMRDRRWISPHGNTGSGDTFADRRLGFSPPGTCQR